MLKRILTAIVALCVFVPPVVFADTWAFPILFALCALVGTFEMLRCIGIHKNGWIAVPLYLIAFSAPLLVRLAGEKVEDAFSLITQASVAVILLLVVYLLAVAVLGHKKLDITSVGCALMMFLYIVGGFAGVVMLNDMESRSICIMVFVGAWVTDTFAYFTGRLLGKHKLIPEVSPKKTVEGAIGGIVFCILAFVAFAFLHNRFWLGDRQPLPPLALAVVGLVVSVVSQVGDLALSQVKRHFGIKDYGNLLPGHGGVLDRFDSVLAVSILMTVVFSMPLFA